MVRVSAAFKKLLSLFLVLVLLASLTPRSAKADEAAPEDDRFTIVWIADTQAIAYYDYDGAFEKMGAWIMDNQGPADIRYIVQTGDAVDNGYHPWQWRNYYKLYDQFAGKIPYIAVAGNHELGVKLQEWDAYLALPEVKAIPEQNKFEGGKAVYRTFTYGDEKFIIVGAGYGATEEAAPWMRHVLEDHADYTAILIFHSYLRNADEYMNAGAKLFEDVVKACPNVRLVLSGHVSKGGNAFRQEEIDDDGDGKADRTVTAMMYNYQSWSMNCGQLRTLEFDTGDRSITVHTFSPVTGKEFKDVTFKSATFTIQDAF